jgi:hypothetical protein
MVMWQCGLCIIQGRMVFFRCIREKKNQFVFLLIVEAFFGNEDIKMKWVLGR